MEFIREDLKKLDEQGRNPQRHHDEREKDLFDADRKKLAEDLQSAVQAILKTSAAKLEGLEQNVETAKTDEMVVSFVTCSSNMQDSVGELFQLQAQVAVGSDHRGGSLPRTAKSPANRPDLPLGLDEQPGRPRGYLAADPVQRQRPQVQSVRAV